MSKDKWVTITELPEVEGLVTISKLFIQDQVVTEEDIDLLKSTLVEVKDD